MGESCQRKLIRLDDYLSNKTVKSCLKVKRKIKKKSLSGGFDDFQIISEIYPESALVFCCRYLKYEIKTRNKAPKQLILDTNMWFVMFSVASAFEVWHGQKTCSKNICLPDMSSIKKNLLKS